MKSLKLLRQGTLFTNNFFFDNSEHHLSTDDFQIAMKWETFGTQPITEDIATFKVYNIGYQNNDTDIRGEKKSEVEIELEP